MPMDSPLIPLFEICSLSDVKKQLRTEAQI